MKRPIYYNKRIPGTDRQIFFDYEPYWDNGSFSFFFSPPFTHRGFEITIKLYVVSFGIQLEFPF